MKVQIRHVIRLVDEISSGLKDSDNLLIGCRYDHIRTIIRYFLEGNGIEIVAMNLRTTDLAIVFFLILNPNSSGLI